MHVTTHGACTDTVRESALEVVSEKNPLTHLVLRPVSVLCLDFRLYALPTGLSLPLGGRGGG